MKKYIITLLSISIITILVTTLTSCSDLLDQRPQGEWTTEDSEGTYQSDIFTMYGKVREFNVLGGSVALCIHNFRSEDAEKGSTADDGSDASRMYDDFEYIATDGKIKGYWEGNYAIANIANNVLDAMKEDVENGKELSAAELVLKSEAHFFRAFVYFNLVRAFGDIPLIDFSADDAAKLIRPKSSASAIYQLIDADLAEAVKYLPLRWENKFIGRLTLGAAKSLQARTYMMRNDWANMNAVANEVIALGIYNLNTPFNQIFREIGENSSESILEFQCTATEALPGSKEIGSEFAAVQGVRGSGEWNLGWGWHTPTQELADAFEQNDPRKDETLLYFAKSEGQAKQMQPNRPYGEVPIAQSTVINRYYNKKVYTDPARRARFTRAGFWFNIRVIRFSDVILMAAESANELGKTDEALQYLEQVRSRARGNNMSILPKVTTTDQVELRNAIRHERRIELAMEWDRFYDLVRWGTAKQVLHAAGKTKYEDRHALLPIPLGEIDKSNGVLVQNPNY